MNMRTIAKKIQKIWKQNKKQLIIGLIVAVVGGVTVAIIMLPTTKDPYGSMKKLIKAQKALLDKGSTKRTKDMFSHILSEHLDNKHVTIKAYEGRAEVYLNQENFDRAIQDANKAIEINKDSRDAYYILGMAYSLMGEHEKAIENFNEALERDTKRKENV